MDEGGWMYDVTTRNEWGGGVTFQSHIVEKVEVVPEGIKGYNIGEGLVFFSPHRFVYLVEKIGARHRRMETTDGVS